MKWKCQLCGYVFEGENPPDSCPSIFKHQSRFIKAPDYIEVTNRRGETKQIPKFQPGEIKTTTEQAEPRVITVQVEHTTIDEERKQSSQTVSIPVTILSKDDEANKPEYISIPVKTIEEDVGIDYAAEYKKQTGRDLETGEYVTQ